MTDPKPSKEAREAAVELTIAEMEEPNPALFATLLEWARDPASWPRSLSFAYDLESRARAFDAFAKERAAADDREACDYTEARIAQEMADAIHDAVGGSQRVDVYKRTRLKNAMDAWDTREHAQSPSTLPTDAEYEARLDAQLREHDQGVRKVRAPTVLAKPLEWHKLAGDVHEVYVGPYECRFGQSFGGDTMWWVMGRGHHPVASGKCDTLEQADREARSAIDKHLREAGLR